MQSSTTRPDVAHRSFLRTSVELTTVHKQKGNDSKATSESATMDTFDSLSLSQASQAPVEMDSNY